MLPGEQNPRRNRARKQSARDGRKLDRFGTRADDKRDSLGVQLSP
jgi:hypothetical protein